MKKEKYYGVAGTNGCGVYDDYSKAEDARCYIKGFKVKKFNDYDEAKEWAQDEAEFAYVNKKVNWFHYKK
ncbi:MAG: viroplasmin family protein [Eubacteriales bacterium]